MAYCGLEKGNREIMAKIYQKITDMVGATPLLELQEYRAANGCGQGFLRSWNI